MFKKNRQFPPKKFQTFISKCFSDDSNSANLQVEFSYSVEWIETQVPFNNREHLKGKFFPKTLEIHWLSVINSVVLVVLLTGFILIILMRVLKNDFNRYNKEEVLDEEMVRNF